MDKQLSAPISMKNCRKRTLGSIGTFLVLCSALRAEEKCPGEIKLLLSPPTIQTVIATLGFEHRTVGRIFLFDTEELGLSKQGAIVRVRQGRDNDLTVKVRLPAGDKGVDASMLRKHFPCEVDRTAAGEDIAYSVGRKYKPHRAPELGEDISGALSPPQKRLLLEAGVSIDWSRVKRLANIRLSKWESAAEPSFRRLALELWESPGGQILELSAKVEPGTGASKYAELQRLLVEKGLTLSASQGTKTSLILENLTHPASPLR
jgi:hypothetical protein